MFHSFFVKSRSLSAVVLLCFSLFLSSCGKDDNKNPNIAGVVGPILTHGNDGLLISMVFESVQIEVGGRYLIPDYVNSYIELSPDLETGGMLLGVFVSYFDVFDNADNLLLHNPQQLPGGRAIPGVPTGQLPAIAFTVEELLDITFYLGSNVWAMFVPVDLGFQGAIATFKFYSSGRRVGNISIVGEDSNGENAGLFLSLLLNSKTAKYIKNRR